MTAATAASPTTTSPTTTGPVELDDEAGFCASPGAPDSATGFIGNALTPTGKGYWLATTGGKVQNFGDAPALGSTGTLNKPVVGLASLLGS